MKKGVGKGKEGRRKEGGEWRKEGEEKVGRGGKEGSKKRAGWKKEGRRVKKEGREKRRKGGEIKVGEGK